MEHRYRIDLNIADIGIRMVTEKPLILEESFQPFLVRAQEPQFTAVFRSVERLPEILEQVLHEDVCFRVHPDGRGGYVRSFFDAPREYSPYALAEYGYTEGKIRVDYLKKGEKCVSETSNSFFHLGLEAMMLEKQRLILHAACVGTPLGGILFSGPSGIGKSTQARLWCAHRGGRLINGDRTILSRKGSGWLGWGSPYAGSSRCHVNDSVGVRCIVMLKQAGANTIRRLGPGEAFRKIFSGLTVYSWDRAYTEKACDLALQLVQQVPVYEFGCTPDISAVECLEKYCMGERRL